MSLLSMISLKKSVTSMLHLYLEATNEKVNECINDVYFANSIMTSKEEAKIKL
ncbi:hypothetical protein [Sulfurimonas sp.]|uniref:hypothetical protein n=1 Tax=Sulfurimonas sp. TaxID=2022749 RepID=UPI002B4AA78A|nr:hypothetical protein [Sulfurimonas sp.]